MAAARARLERCGDARWELSGELDFDSAPALLEAGEVAFRDAVEAEVGLADVRRADSAGLAVLLEWSLQAAAAGRRLRYRDLPETLVSLAGIGEVDELLERAG